jgi:hypothetical protein
MARLKRVRVIKKVQEEQAWRFVSLKQNGSRYVWDDRPGIYYLEWWEGAKRRRETAGQTPSEVIAAKRRKQDEFRPPGRIAPQLESASIPKAEPQPDAENRLGTDARTALLTARDLFIKHVEAHSPDKPETARRYSQVLEHFVRLCGHRQFLEAITRADMDEYKIARRQEKSERHDRLITARTVKLRSQYATNFLLLLHQRA